MIALLISLVIWALIFYVLFWGLTYIGVPEPFAKVIKVLLVLAVVIVIISLLMGKVQPFPILQDL